MPSEKKTLRAAIYTRYSSDNQREASIEDQIEVCRRYAQLQGWTIVEVYADHALSGASRFRPAFQQMQVDAEARRFDVIIVEALDRLSRKLADVADLHDRLTFLGLKLHEQKANPLRYQYSHEATFRAFGRPNRPLCPSTFRESP